MNKVRKAVRIPPKQQTKNPYSNKKDIYRNSVSAARPHEKKQQIEFSKKLIADVRSLLWVVTLGGLFLAYKCITLGYLGSLPWIGSMVGLPWTAHGVICSFYLNMAKSDHRVGGITYASAAANGFNTNMSGAYNHAQMNSQNGTNGCYAGYVGSADSPGI